MRTKLPKKRASDEKHRNVAIANWQISETESAGSVVFVVGAAAITGVVEDVAVIGLLAAAVEALGEEVTDPHLHQGENGTPTVPTVTVMSPKTVAVVGRSLGDAVQHLALEALTRGTRHLDPGRPA